MFEPDKAILAGVDLPSKNHIPIEESLAELARLASTAGAIVVGRIQQKRQKPDLTYYIGSGKLEEIKALMAGTSATMLIFDSEILPAQERNLEEALDIQIVDRTELILNIFAKHAKSREGKIQVELAKLQYQLPRLSGMWEHLSRQRGGIGLREVGEKQIEIDRRIINKRISLLKKEIEKVRKERSARRENRRRNQIPSVALVGYTNSGKSTLLNVLTDAKVLTQDQLFATLDPTTRQLYLPNNRQIVLTDTVGFIQKLPHQLVEAFHSTLEEVIEADLLLHVVDAAHPYFEDQIKAVMTVLEELKCADKPILTIFNKADKLMQKISNTILEKYQPAIVISALGNKGLDRIMGELARFFDKNKLFKIETS
ncbi:MAG: GTPase HflX [Candidatus Margulisbacteria bacterium]|nr:GTPase HflX [Candidatus Margulisiibacteriota bacterium]